jgi:phytoene/squalene synthetase
LHGLFHLVRERLKKSSMAWNGSDRDRYDNFDALRLYCHRVAGVVGLLSAEIFGYQDAATLDYRTTSALLFS